MRAIGYLLIISAFATFFFAFKGHEDDVIVTATPKGYAPPRPILQTSWEDAIPVVEPEAAAIPLVAFKEPPPPAPMVAAKVASASKWQPLRRYMPRGRRLTKIGYSPSAKRLARSTRSRRR